MNLIYEVCPLSLSLLYLTSVCLLSSYSTTVVPLFSVRSSVLTLDTYGTLSTWQTYVLFTITCVQLFFFFFVVEKERDGIVKKIRETSWFYSKRDIVKLLQCEVLQCRECWDHPLWSYSWSKRVISSQMNSELLSLFN